MLAGDATLLALRHSNVYLEPSWVGGFIVHRWVRQLGAHRIMFGSDHADNAATELAKFRGAGLTHDESSWVLGRSAIAVFKLKG